MLLKVVFSIFFFSQFSFAITLEEIKNLSVERSSLLSAQEMEKRALGSEMLLQGKWQNPQLMSQLGTLKSASMAGGTAEFSITQAVPLSDRYSLRRELSQLALSMYEKHHEFQKKWVAHQAVLSAWRVFVTHELYKHSKERSGRLAILKRYMQTRARLSQRQRVELNLFSNTLVRMESEQDQKLNNFNLALEDLIFWTGKTIDLKELNLEIPTSTTELILPDIDLENDLQVTLSKTQLKSAGLDQELARKERRPDLFIGAGHRVENVSPQNYFNYGIIGLNIPIWDTGSYRIEAAAARLKRDEKMADEIYKKSKLHQQRQRELVRHSLALLKRFPKSMVSQNESSILEAEQAFKQGVLDANTFIQTENQSHELIDQVYLVWMSYLDNLSNLQLMQSKDLQWNK